LILPEVLTRSGNRIQVLSCKHGDDLLGNYGMLEGQSQRGPRVAGSAAANGVDEDQHRALLVPQCRIDLGRGRELLGAEAGYLCTHGGDESGVVRHG
jgi:hypothetical protein